VEAATDHIHLSCPAGPAGRYRWAQLDDYMPLRRADFRWRAPLSLEVRARVSVPDLPGTWGFGLWNDPFSATLGLGGMGRRWPTLPNAAWFFYASPPNHLAFRDDHPAHGLLAATFSAPAIPAPLVALGLPALPLLAWPPTARILRRLAGRVIREAAVAVTLDPTDWHLYRLEWRADAARFLVDGQVWLETPVSPRPPLGLVIWIDNQHAAFPPDGRLRMGTLPNPEPAWLKVASLRCADLR
jgi:hypothetical protein